MTSRVSGVAERDLRLDFFRGLALFSIFVDHIPTNFFARFTVQSFMLADAAEVFILISGYAAGMVYGRALDNQPPLRAAARVYHRAWQLYVAHIFLFMLYMATVAHMASLLNVSLYAEEFHAANFLNETDVAVIMALTLRFQPVFMNILPLYIILLFWLPLVLLGFRHYPKTTFAISLILWATVQFDGSINLPAYPGADKRWYFNPFAWQALFVIGAWFGWRNTRGSVAWLASPWLLRAAIFIAIVSLVLRVNWTTHVFYDPVPALFAETLWPLMNKTDLSFTRFLSVLAAAVLVARLVPPRSRFLESRFAKPFVMCGRHSLHIFCLGILLSMLGYLIINEHYGGIALQGAVTAGGIAIMVALAALMDWFKAAGVTKPRETTGG